MKVVEQTGLNYLVARLMKEKYSEGAYIVWYPDEFIDIMWDILSIIKLTEEEVPNIRNESIGPSDSLDLPSGNGELFIDGKRIEGTEVR